MVNFHYRDSKYSFISVGLVLLAIIDSSVYVQATDMFSTLITVLDRVLNVLLLCFMFLKGLEKNRSSRWLLLSVWPLVYWVVDFLHSDNPSIFSLMPTLTLVFYCLLKKNLIIDVYNIFRCAMILISIIGIICYLGFITGIFPPLSIENFYEEGSTNLYASYKVCLLYLSTSGALCRLCGIFNEPGWMGTICALLLIADKLNLKSKGNLILLCAGILAFSLAFWFLLVLYFVIDSIYNRKIKSILVAGLSVIFFYYVQNIQTGNENIDRFLERFVIEDGQLSGNDRTTDDLMIIWNEVVNDNSKLCFGLGRDIGWTGSSSYLSLIIKNGILGCIIVYIPFFNFLILSFKDNKYARLLVVAFIASMYQRPHIFMLIYFIILIGGCEFLRYNKDVKPFKLNKQ